MKYFKTQNVYKAANVVFNPETCEATSYAWWSFVKKIKGKVIFNEYRYSNTTAKHQWKVRQLLNSLGIKINRSVKVGCGLQSIDDLKRLNAMEKVTLQALEARENAKREARNKRAREKRVALKHAQSLNLDQNGKPRLRIVS